MNHQLIDKALASPVEHPRRKLILVALAHRAGRKLDLRINPREISLCVGLGGDGAEKVVNHITALDGNYLDFHGVLEGDIPMVRLDMSKLAEMDYFEEIS